eukprot:12912605-Prorocentrum_lima.AAC.1
MLGEFLALAKVTMKNGAALLQEDPLWRGKICLVLGWWPRWELLEVLVGLKMVMNSLGDS